MKLPELHLAESGFGSKICSCRTPTNQTAKIKLKNLWREKKSTCKFLKFLFTNPKYLYYWLWKKEAVKSLTSFHGENRLGQLWHPGRLCVAALGLVAFHEPGG